MKRVLKVVLIAIGVATALAACFVGYNLWQTHGALNDPRFADDYYTEFEAGGPLEARYAGKGPHEVASAAFESDDPSIKNVYLYYPAELEGSDAQWPLVMVVNGSQTPAKTYLPFFERLASWGFVVAGTDDPQAGTGESASAALDWVLSECPLAGRIDQARMGVAGYSQGGAGAVNAATKYENGGLYRCLFTGSAAYPLLATTQGWAWDPADVRIDWFMTAATGESDDTGVADVNAEYGGVCPLASLVDAYGKLPDDVAKVRGRCVGAEHEDMLQRTDGYMTAWFLWRLCGDEEASRVFVGDCAEIAQNPNWQDVEKSSQAA